MECPEEMLKTSDGHMCNKCFRDPENFKNSMNENFEKIHIDMPTDDLLDTFADNFAESLVEDVFQHVWYQKKRELKDLSKKELSKEMFGAGVYLGLQTFFDSMKNMEMDEEMKKEK
jgi:hypothetical protein